MAELLLDQIRSQIRNRARELESAAREYERLDAALTALGGPLDTRSATWRPAAKPAAAAKRRPKPSVSDGRASTERAPRGANRAAVLGVLADRPGVVRPSLRRRPG